MTVAHVTDDVVLFARQPLFESTGKVLGYELLFRRADGSGWPIEDEVQATAHVVVAAFADLGLGAVTSGVKAWINIPKEFLFETDIAVLPKHRVVLEILERDTVDEPMVQRVRQLAREGYQIALDDFVWRDEMRPLVECATYVKLDMQALGVAGISEQMRRLAPYDVQIVAEKVENATEREFCARLGLSLYQGYFFERPSMVRGRPTPHQDIAKLQRASRLGPSATFEDVESLLRLDPGLTFRLLRYVNSAAVSLRHRVGSLRQTLMLVGAETVRRWLLLVLMGDLAGSRPEVLISGLVRARVCETLAREFRCDPEEAFVVGLLSICDVLFDRPIAEAAKDLPLAPALSDALVKHEGPLGKLLETAIAVQHGERPSRPSAAAAGAAAIVWADAQVAMLSGAAQAA